MLWPKNLRKKLSSASAFRYITQANRVQNMVEAYREACARMEDHDSIDATSSSAPASGRQFVSRLGEGEWSSSREVFANNELNMDKVGAIGFDSSSLFQSRTF